VTQAPPIDGHCAPGFEPVREAFLENFRGDGEHGAALHATAGGRVLVDLWGGWTDRRRRRPWRCDTIVNAYSVGKGVLALLVLDAVAHRQVALDDPVIRWWPEFGAAGKTAITLRTLLTHSAGLPALRPLLPSAAKYDWARMCRLLAAETPFWEPGTAHGYHANTLGFLVGEVLRRATGSGPARLLRHFAGPAEADYFWGVPRAAHGRVAPVLLDDGPTVAAQRAGAVQQARVTDADRAGMIWRAYFNPPGASGFGSVNTRAWREAVIPSTNGHGDARGIARIYASALAGAVPRELLEEAARIQVEGHDLVTERPSAFGLAFQRPTERRPMGRSARAFGHFGYGGSLGFADPDLGLGFGYVTNRPAPRFVATRAVRVSQALYDCLALHG
jgi:CubicO group peptidase (beta-lactamase class C family)